MRATGPRACSAPEPRQPACCGVRDARRRSAARPGPSGRLRRALGNVSRQRLGHEDVCGRASGTRMSAGVPRARGCLRACLAPEDVCGRASRMSVGVPRAWESDGCASSREMSRGCASRMCMSRGCASRMWMSRGCLRACGCLAAALAHADVSRLRLEVRHLTHPDAAPGLSRPMALLFFLIGLTLLFAHHENAHAGWSQVCQPVLASRQPLLASRQSLVRAGVHRAPPCAAGRPRNLSIRRHAWRMQPQPASAVLRHR
jgi:hypothetical protein